MGIDIKQAQELFHAALEHPPAEWGHFLEQACPANEAQRRYVVRLLEAHQAAGEEERTVGTEGTAAFVSPQPELKNIGPYKLLERLGEGGMGTVYLAEQTTPVRRKVAVKVVKLGMDSKAVLARFQAERQALALMDHPNIAKVLDGGRTDEGRPYFVMEYVKGVPITQYCDDARVSVRERLSLFTQVCQAVQHAHQKGVIHRDLKPTNILVCLYDGKPVPKVIDFGLAKATQQPLTEHTLHTAHGVMVGTPQYMSPEQAEFNNLDIDTRSDVYSLGVILYELLTGTTPLEGRRFKEAAWVEMLRLIKEEEPPKPSTRLSSSTSLPSVAAQRQLEPAKLSRLVRGELDWIVMKCLEKDRCRRYETANGLAMDVQRYLTDEPVLAGPPSATYRLRKFVRRNRVTVVATLLVFAALLAGVVGTTLAMIQATRAEDAAQQARDQAVRERDAATQAQKETGDALTDLTDNTVGQFLSQSPQFSPEQREFLERVIARYNRLATELPDSPFNALWRARCAFQIGKIYLKLGDYARAVENFSQSDELLRRLAAQAPADLGIITGRLSTLTGLATAYSRLGQHEKSRRATEQGIEVGEQCLREHPDHLPTLRSLSMHYHNRVVGDWADEGKRYEGVNRGVALAEKAFTLGGNATNSQDLQSLAECLSIRINHYSHLRQLSSNHVALARADVERLRNILPPEPTVQLTLSFADSCNYLSHALSRLGDWEAAIGFAREGVGLCEAIVTKYPGDVEHRLRLLSHYRVMAEHLLNAGRGKDADLVLRKAIELGDKESPHAHSVFSLMERIHVGAALAWYSLEGGNHEEARRGLDRLVKTGRELIAATRLPDGELSGEIRLELKKTAHCCNRIGHLAEKLERWPECLEFTRKQLEYARRLLAAGPRPNEDAANYLLWGHWSLSKAYTSTQRWPEAIEALKNLVLTEAWIHTRPNDEGVSQHFVEYAALLKAAGHGVEMESWLAPGIAEREALVKANPASEQVVQELRRAYRMLGLTHEFAQRFQPAMEAFEKVIALGESPDPAYDASKLGRAVCLDALGKETEAESAYPGYSSFKGGWFRLHKLVKHGRPIRAVVMLEQKKVIVGTTGLDSYNKACIYALAAAVDRRDEYALRAVALLREAADRRYFDDPKQVSHLKNDEDLKALRDRKDFKEFLAQLEKLDTLSK